MADRGTPVGGEARPAAGRDRMFLVALAACCAGPMVAIIVLTSVVGVAVGPAVALTVGLVAAGLCVAVMIGRHHTRGGTAEPPG